MARSRRTVKHFAKLAGIAADKAVQLLIQAGVRVPKPGAVIPKGKILKAQIALGLSQPKAIPPPKKKDKVPAAELRRQKQQQQRAKIEAEQARRKQEKQARLAQPKRKNLIGKEQDLTFLKFKDVEKIHWVLVDDFSSSKDPIVPAGIKEEHLLHSALTRCRTCLGKDDKYPTAPMAAAALMHSLIHDHPFHNGNKRTALVSVLVFFDKNGWTLVADEDDLYDYFLQVGAHGIVDAGAVTSAEYADAEVAEISQWLAQHTKRTEHRHKPMQFRQLRQILNSYNCSMSSGSTGSKMNIRRGELKTQIGFAGKSRVVDASAIGKVRRDLQLDEDHGYDTDMFYNAEKRLPAFITKYRKTLDRLAKV